MDEVEVWDTEIGGTTHRCHLGLALPTISQVDSIMCPNGMSPNPQMVENSRGLWGARVIDRVGRITSGGYHPLTEPKDRNQEKRTSRASHVRCPRLWSIGQPEQPPITGLSWCLIPYSSFSIVQATAPIEPRLLFHYLSHARRLKHGRSAGQSGEILSDIERFVSGAIQ